MVHATTWANQEVPDVTCDQSSIGQATSQQTGASMLQLLAGGSTAAALPFRAWSALQVVAGHLTEQQGCASATYPTLLPPSPRVSVTNKVVRAVFAAAFHACSWWAFSAPCRLIATAVQADLAQPQSSAVGPLVSTDQTSTQHAVRGRRVLFLHQGTLGAVYQQQAQQLDSTESGYSTSQQRQPWQQDVWSGNLPKEKEKQPEQASQMLLRRQQQNNMLPQHILDLLQQQLDLQAGSKGSGTTNKESALQAVQQLVTCASCFSASQAVRALYLMVKLDVATKPAFAALSNHLDHLREWNALPVSDLVLFCWCCARTNLGSTQALKQVIQVLLTRNHEMNAQDVALMSWCVARQRWYHARDPLLLLTLQSASARVASNADTMAAGMLAWTSSSLPQLDAGRGLRQLLQSATMQFSQWDIRTVTAVLYAAAKHRQHPPGLLEQASQRILVSIPTPPAAPPQTMSSSHMVRLFWAMCVLERHASPIVRRVAEQLVQLASQGELTPRQVGMIVDGCKAAGWADHAFLSEVLRSLMPAHGWPEHVPGEQLSMLAAITLTQQLAELQFRDEKCISDWIDRQYRQMAEQPLCINKLVTLARLAAHQHSLPDALWRDLVEEMHHVAVWYPEAWQGKDVVIALQALGQAAHQGHAHVGLQHWLVRAMLDLASAHVEFMSVEEFCRLCKAALPLRCLPSDVLHSLLRRLLARHMDSPHARQQLARLFCWWGGILPDGMLAELLHALKQNARKLKPAEAAYVAWSSMHMHQLHNSSSGRTQALLDQLCSELCQTFQLPLPQGGHQLTA